MGGTALPPDTWLVRVSPVLMDDDRLLLWHPRQPVAFNLIQAKHYLGRGESTRRSIMGNLKRRSDGDGYEPVNSRAVLDCLSHLQAAVLFAFAAVESLANHSIDHLPDDAIIAIELRKGESTEIPKAEMVRRLNLDEKLSRVVPLLPDGRNVKGTTAWPRYRALKYLRDELLHVKEQGYSPEPELRTAYDRLILGEGDSCVEDAVAIVQGARPDFLQKEVLDALA